MIFKKRNNIALICSTIVREEYTCYVLHDPYSSFGAIFFDYIEVVNITRFKVWGAEHERFFDTL